VATFVFTGSTDRRGRGEPIVAALRDRHAADTAVRLGHPWPIPEPWREDRVVRGPRVGPVSAPDGSSGLSSGTVCTAVMIARRHSGATQAMAPLGWHGSLRTKLWSFNTCSNTPDASSSTGTLASSGATRRNSATSDGSA
jgi:hypothetical protein